MKKPILTWMAVFVMACGFAAPAAAQMSIPAPSMPAPSMPAPSGTSSFSGQKTAQPDSGITRIAPIPKAPDAAAAAAPAPSTLRGLTVVNSSGIEPTPTSAGHIAVIYSRMIGQLPPFEDWSRATPEFKAANDFNRAAVFEQKILEMKDLFRLSTASDPIIVEFPLKLSDYSFTNKGFLIENFSADSYSPFQFSGQNFAIVLPTAVDTQFLPVDENVALKLDQIAAQNGRMVKAYLYVQARAADKAPMQLGADNYNVISAQLLNIAIYDPASHTLLWQKSVVGEEAPDRRLLDLKK